MNRQERRERFACLEEVGRSLDIRGRGRGDDPGRASRGAIGIGHECPGTTDGVGIGKAITSLQVHAAALGLFPSTTRGYPGGKPGVILAARNRGFDWILARAEVWQTLFLEVLAGHLGGADGIAVIHGAVTGCLTACPELGRMPRPCRGRRGLADIELGRRFGVCGGGRRVRAHSHEIQGCSSGADAEKLQIAWSRRPSARSSRHCSREVPLYRIGFCPTSR